MGQLLDDDAEACVRATESFLAAKPMPVADWPEIEQELDRALERGWRHQTE